MGCHYFSEGAVTQLQNNGYCSAICFVQKTGSKVFNDARMLQLSFKKSKLRYIVKQFCSISRETSELLERVAKASTRNY